MYRANCDYLCSTLNGMLHVVQDSAPRSVFCFRQRRQTIANTNIDGRRISMAGEPFGTFQRWCIDTRCSMRHLRDAHVRRIIADTSTLVVVYDRHIGTQLPISGNFRNFLDRKYDLDFQ